MTREFVLMLLAILEYRIAGFRYKEIDKAIALPKRAYLIMNGKRARFIFESGILERA